MLIGFDASRAFSAQNTGTENYSLNLLKALAEVDQKNHYRVYLRGFSRGKTPYLPNFPNLPNNFELRPIAPTRLWTQIGLALETWRAPVDLLFVPAHTLPILRRRSTIVYRLSKIFRYRLSIDDLRLTKYIVTIHDLGVEYLPGYHKFPDRFYLDLASKYAAHHADRLIAVSESTRADLIKRYGVAGSQIDVVYEGVDGRFFKPQSLAKVQRVKSKYKISGDYFLYVGTVQPRKNLMFLIDIFNTFVKSNSVKLKGSKYNKETQNINLIIAGKMGWDYHKISQKASEKVRFLGYVDRQDLPALYCGAKAAVFPSLFEGFGLPILESLSSGCPVIASDIPVHCELFKVISRRENAFTRGYKAGNGKWQMANGQYLAKNKNIEAMTLANLNDGRRWLSLLDQYVHVIDKSMTNTNTSLLRSDLFDWQTVAKETLAVFNSVSKVKKW